MNNLTLRSICAFPFNADGLGRKVIRTSVYDSTFAREIHYAPYALIREAINAASVFMAKQRFRAFDPSQVIESLRILSNEILTHSEYLASIDARWTSRSWFELTNQSLTKASETIRWFCDVAPSAFGRFEGLPEGPNLEYREDPLGIVAAITPWNDPLVAFAWKVVPALLAGNAVLWKPSEHCLETASWVVGRLYAQGLPKERLQLLLGDRKVGEVLVREKINAVSFTGSSKTARHITVMANEDRLVKMHVEAGGKGCAVIGPNETDDALGKYAEILCNAAFSNQGQICSAPTLVFSPADTLDRLIGFIQSAAVDYAPADPTNHASRIGGLVSMDKKQLLKTLLEVEADDTVALTNVDNHDHGFNPTLVINPKTDSRLVTEELFGPIVVILTYQVLDEVINFINNQEYGLANGLFSRDSAIQQLFATAVMGGILHINSWGMDPIGVPFGGTKNSGFGKEKSSESLRFFTTLKPICKML